jgi:hypothetical protein
MYLRLICVLLALAFAAAPARAGETCPPDNWTPAKLEALKAKGFAIEASNERQALALALLDCLSAPEPALRDGIAFEAWSTWLRADALDQATRQAALSRLLPQIAPGANDAAGFRQPFSALLLSEIARTDRIKPWLEADQRAGLVEAAARYLESVRDYRGFITGEGWRHGVAHGSDLLMQLALNPALDKPQLDRILAAVAAQVAPRGQAYVFGEAERLARPVLFVAVRGLHSEAEWTGWFARLAAPPAAGWPSVFHDADGLARRHDLRAFLLGMYAQARDSKQPAVQALLPGINAQLEAVP